MNGKYLKALIIKKGYTIKSISIKINVNNNTISNWINNRNTNQIDNFINLLNELNADEYDIKELKKE